MSPNREAKAVANAEVKPSVVVVPTCKTAKDNLFTRGDVLVSWPINSVGDVLSCTPSRTVAWNPASEAFKAWNNACGDVAREPHRARKRRRAHGATLARSPFIFLNFGSGEPDSRTQTKLAQKRGCVVDVIETPWRVGGGERAF